MSKAFNADYIQLNQDDVDIVITKMNVKELIENTEPDVFDSSENRRGYQRPLNLSQVQKIYEYLRTEEHSILPTSIILAIDHENIELGNKDGKITIHEKLRIVDGQHRIAAMKRIIEEFENGDLEIDTDDDEYERFCNWEYPINIMLLDREVDSDRYVEIRAFVDINKKGMKVSTDLADSNIARIREMLSELPPKDAVHHICTLISKELINEPTSVWYQSIKEGDNSIGDKLIGVSSFRLSIAAIVRKYLVRKYGRLKSYKMDIITSVAGELKEIFKRYWVIIGDTWEDAFEWDLKYNAYRVDTDYNIQKSLGVSALHKLLNYYYDNENTLEDALEQTQNVLEETRIDSKSWLIGNEFSVFTSGSGHKKLRDILIERSNYLE